MEELDIESEWFCAETENELESIYNALNISKEHGLQTEVIWSAMNLLKCDHKVSIVSALDFGLSEWVK
jgi:hypothetical protein